MKPPAADLRSIPLFAGLPGPVLKRLTGIAAPREFARHAMLFSQGDEAEGFYVILSGKIRVYKASAGGKEQTLHIFGPGQPVGEAAVFSGEPYPANAEAFESGRVLFFPKDGFLALIREYPEMALTLLASASRRLVRFAQLVEDLSLKEIPHRLAAYLQHLVKRQHSDVVDLEMTKRHLASVLGTTPETLSRVLAKFSKDGAVTLAGARRVRIINQQYLARAARSAPAGEGRKSRSMK